MLPAWDRHSISGVSPEDIKNYRLESIRIVNHLLSLSIEERLKKAYYIYAEYLERIIHSMGLFTEFRSGNRNFFRFGISKNLYQFDFDSIIEKISVIGNKQNSDYVESPEFNAPFKVPSQLVKNVRYFINETDVSDNSFFSLMLVSKQAIMAHPLMKNPQTISSEFSPSVSVIRDIELTMSDISQKILVILSLLTQKALPSHNINGTDLYKIRDLVNDEGLGGKQSLMEMIEEDRYMSLERIAVTLNIFPFFYNMKLERERETLACMVILNLYIRTENPDTYIFILNNWKTSGTRNEEGSLEFEMISESLKKDQLKLLCSFMRSNSEHNPYLDLVGGEKNMVLANIDKLGIWSPKSHLIEGGEILKKYEEAEYYEHIHRAQGIPKKTEFIKMYKNQMNISYYFRVITKEIQNLEEMTVTDSIINQYFKGELINLYLTTIVNKAGFNNIREMYDFDLLARNVKTGTMVSIYEETSDGTYDNLDDFITKNFELFFSDLKIFKFFMGQIFCFLYAMQSCFEFTHNRLNSRNILLKKIPLQQSQPVYLKYSLYYHGKWTDFYFEIPHKAPYLCKISDFDMTNMRVDYIDGNEIQSCILWPEATKYEDVITFFNKIQDVFTLGVDLIESLIKIINLNDSSALSLGQYTVVPRFNNFLSHMKKNISDSIPIIEFLKEMIPKPDGETAIYCRFRQDSVFSYFQKLFDIITHLKNNLINDTPFPEIDKDVMNHILTKKRESYFVIPVYNNNSLSPEDFLFRSNLFDDNKNIGENSLFYEMTMPKYLTGEYLTPKIESITRVKRDPMDIQTKYQFVDPSKKFVIVIDKNYKVSIRHTVSKKVVFKNITSLEHLKIFLS